MPPSFVRSHSTMKRILILAANPKDTDQLRLNEEVREIQLRLERARHREQFEIISRWAVRIDDLQQVLLDYEPDIVHFSGHGAGIHGLVLESDDGTIQLVSSSALARLFKFFKDKIQCVVLNACYSEAQAKEIHKHIDYVVGMNKAVGDRAAIGFAGGFYVALGAGRSIEDAFEYGCISIDLKSIPESETPVLKQRNRKLLQLPEPPLSPVPGSRKASDHLERPEGQLPIGSLYYVERPPIETDCYEAIVKPGALIRIKAPRQMGKSSLLGQVLHHAAEQGCKSVAINLQFTDTEFLETLDLFLQWFCASITYELGLPDRLEDYWKGVLGSKNKCTNYLQRYLLSEISNPIALGLDGVDEISKHPEVAAGFFGLLRAWHEKAKNEPIWQKLRLVIVHSNEVYIPLDINQSPFNVGLPVELPELTRSQVQDLVNRHGLRWTDNQMSQLARMVDGHPYLVRVALYELARDRMSFEQLMQVAPTEAGPYADHLRHRLWTIEKDEALLAALKRVVTAEAPVTLGTNEAFKLRGLGLVRLQGSDVTSLCDLYRLYFRNHLGK